DRLAERPEGHPLFAMQLLGHWIDRGAIRIGADGFRVAESADVELPQDIHALWMERVDRLLDGLPGDARLEALEGLELAAALGRNVDEREWRAVLADAELEPPPALVDRLVDRGLVERTAGGWAFAHGLLVDSLGRRARQAGRWRRHHRTCARTLTSLSTADDPGLRERIAEHWVDAGELD
ncbi:MAG: hypothetical protein ABEN55_21960, partial [Bradymonadaceae bacterium]